MSLPLERKVWRSIFITLECYGIVEDRKMLFREIRPAETRLADDGQKCPYQDFSMIRNRNGYRAAILFLLHDNMAASTTDFNETVSYKDGADFFAGKNGQLRQG